MKKLIPVIAIVAALCFTTSCGKKNTSEYSDVCQSASFDECFEMEQPMAMKSERAMSSNSMNDAASSSVERKLILNGSARIETKSLKGLSEKVEEWVKKYGGYVSSSDSWESATSVTVRIPSKHFYEAMNAAAGFGKIINHSINTNDVTDTYYDLETRIETKKILRDKLQGYLKQATNLKDMLEVERQLNEVQTELESIEGKMKRLSGQIDYSTITIEFFLPTGQTETGYDYPDYGEGFREFKLNVLYFLKALVFGIIYIIVYGIPLAALALLLFWLLFGKVGIIRKLFNKLKK